MQEKSPFHFDQELSDVEEMLLRMRPTDDQLQELYESTEVEVDVDPSESESREHRVRVSQEPPLTRGNLFARADAHPNVLALVLFEQYEDAWLTWDPEALDDEITSMYGQPHPVNVGKVAAVQAAYTKSAAWDEWHYFLFTCQALNDEIVDPSYFRPPTVAEAGFCCSVLHLIDDKMKWSEEVQVFLAQVLRHEHFLYAPEEFHFLTYPTSGEMPAYDRVKVERFRKDIRTADESLEGYFAQRLHDYDVYLAAMRKRLRDQLHVVRRKA